MREDKIRRWFEKYGLIASVLTPVVTSAYIIGTSGIPLSELLTAGWSYPASGVAFDVAFWGIIGMGLMMQLTWKAKHGDSPKRANREG